MNILFAEPDRDLLRCYAALLSLRGHGVTQVFEGTEALRRLRETPPELLLLDLALPRVEPGQLIREAREKKIPTLALLDRPVTADLLLNGPPAAAWLSLPFLPEELFTCVEETRRKAISDLRFSCGDGEVDVSAFAFVEGLPLCSREIDLLKAVAAGEAGFDRGKDAGACVPALNQKFFRLGKTARIRYYPKKGYGLVVNGHE